MNKYAAGILFFLALLPLKGCAVTDVVTYGLAGQGYGDLKEYWRVKSTPDLMKHLILRRNYPDDYRSMKHSMDFEIILNILKERTGEKGVCECFQKVRQRTKYDEVARQVDAALSLCGK